MTEDLKKLRFKNEDDSDYPDWEEKKLGQITSFLKTRTADEIDYASVESLRQNFGGLNSVLETNNKVAIYTPKDSILIGNIRPYLKKTAIAKRDIKTDSDIISLQINQNLAMINFVYSIIASNLFFKGFQRNSKGTKMPRGDKSFIEKYSFPLPSLPEQEKIGEFFSKLDERIEAQAKLIELLKTRKKGYSQRIFGGTLRFKKDDGSDYPDWEEKRISEFFQKISKKGNSDLDFITVMENKTITRPMKNQGYKNTITDEKKRKSKIVLRNDFIVDLTSYQRGILMSMMDGLTSNAYTVMRLNDGNSTRFWKEILVSKNTINRFASITPIGARQGKMIEISSLFSFIFNVPSPEEQEKIGAFLSSLDSEIGQEEARLEAFKQEKKAYSQRMLG